MARALIIGCGCRGRALGARLLADAWAVRGTSRDPAQVEEIEAAGIEAALADPGHPGSVFELVGDVAVIHWLVGRAEGEPEAVAAIHGPRLERLLEKLVDTPLRGFVYEAAGTVPAAQLAQGAAIVRSAQERWRIPVAIVDVDPADAETWLKAMLVATGRLIAPDA